MSPYSTRHPFCTLLAERGVPPGERSRTRWATRTLIVFERVYNHRIRPEVTKRDDLWDGEWDGEDDEDEWGAA